MAPNAATERRAPEAGPNAVARDDSLESLLRLAAPSDRLGAEIVLGQTLAAERFVITRKLGRGGMGVVFEALDRDRGGRVALKVLPVLDPESLLRFKNEFRTLRDLRHPNLVLLHELMEEGRRWFISMELIDGSDFLAYVRPGSELDAGRLTGALRQLAQALVAVHAAGRVHRDVKPDNILVTREGRLVLLDFGLAVEATLDDRLTEEGGVVGTIAYMAPEQARTATVGPAADWYAVGVLLYQALEGRLPFQGPWFEVLTEKQRSAPTRPGANPALGDLEQLCVELLHPDPARRPSAADVLTRLPGHGAEERTATPQRRTAAQPPPFVGRTAELERMAAAFEATRRGSTVTVLVQGESGVGKSALLDHFAETLRDRKTAAVVLTGRCYERESVPYRGLDSIVDGLSRLMARLPASEAGALVPVNAALLGEVFPVLRRVDAFAQAPLPRHQVVDPQERRSRVFGALRELLFRLAERRPTLIAIDDLQWSDADSLALLREILRLPEAPALLLAATVRPPVPAFALPGDVRVLELGRLRACDARELAAALLGSGEGVSAAGTMAEEARGHPLFIHTLARHLRTHGPALGSSLQLDDAIRRQVAAFEPSGQRLVEVVAIAGAPITLTAASQAAKLELPELDRLASTLAAASLIRTSGARHVDLIEPYHDRVREAVTAQLEPETRRDLHERLAQVLTLTEAPFETLAVHWRGAGDAARAASYAVLAADDAMRALAFERAARLYRTALELGPVVCKEPGELHAKLAEALANAGRGREAAEAFLAAASAAEEAGASSQLLLLLRRKAAAELLRSGHIDRGMAVLRIVLRASGIRVAATHRRALLSVIVRRALVRLRGLHFVRRSAEAVSANELARADVCWAATMGLGLNDFIRGMDFQTRHLLLTLRAGEPSRILRAYSFEVGFTASMGWKSRHRTARLLVATQQLAARVDHPSAPAWVYFAQGVSAWLMGHFKAGLSANDDAERIFRDRCTGVAWELSTVRLFANDCLWGLGEYGELSRRVAVNLREAEERGDLYAISTLRTGPANVVWLAADDPVRALEETERAIRTWSSQEFHLQHYWHMQARAEIGLYAGNGRQAYAELLQVWPTLSRSVLLRIQLNVVLCFSLRGRCALAAAAATGGVERERGARNAEHCAKRLERQHLPWALALAGPLRAGAAALRGEYARAAALYELAATALDAVDMSLHAAVARRRRGELLCNEQGAALVESADALARIRGVARPERMAAMIAPCPLNA